jgi:hypothetical protein
MDDSYPIRTVISPDFHIEESVRVPQDEKVVPNIVGRIVVPICAVGEITVEEHDDVPETNEDDFEELPKFNSISEVIEYLYIVGLEYEEPMDLRGLPITERIAALGDVSCRAAYRKIEGELGAFGFRATKLFGDSLNGKNDIPISKRLGFRVLCSAVEEYGHQRTAKYSDDMDRSIHPILASKFGEGYFSCVSVSMALCGFMFEHDIDARVAIDLGYSKHAVNRANIDALSRTLTNADENDGFSFDYLKSKLRLLKSNDQVLSKRQHHPVVLADSEDETLILDPFSHITLTPFDMGARDEKETLFMTSQSADFLRQHSESMDLIDLIFKLFTSKWDDSNIKNHDEYRDRVEELFKKMCKSASEYIAAGDELSEEERRTSENLHNILKSLIYYGILSKRLMSDDEIDLLNEHYDTEEHDALWDILKPKLTQRVKTLLSVAILSPSPPDTLVLNYGYVYEETFNETTSIGV